MAINPEDLGFTREEMAQRVARVMADDLMANWWLDDDDRSVTTGSSAFAKEMEKRVLACVNTAIEDIAAKNVLPNVGDYIEKLCLQETNKWGEATGRKLTFIEYLVERAEAYMQEKVDYKGKSKAEAGGFPFTGTQTRITHLVHQHLHYNIETAMKKALETANAAIVGGIEGAVKIKLAEIVNGLKIKVDLK